MISVYTSRSEKKFIPYRRQGRVGSGIEKKTLHRVEDSSILLKGNIYVKTFYRKVYFNRQRSVKTSSKSQDIYIKNKTHSPQTGPAIFVRVPKKTATPAQPK